MNVVAAFLDICLVIAAIAAYLARPRIGGQLQDGLRTLLMGVMVLGFAHLLETGLFIIFNVEVQINEVIHRLVVGAGFILVIWGFLKMRRAFEQ